MTGTAPKLEAWITRMARASSDSTLARIGEALVPPVDVEGLRRAIGPWDRTDDDTLADITDTRGAAQFMFVRDPRGEPILTDARMASVILGVRQVLTEVRTPPLEAVGLSPSRARRIP